MKYIFFLLLFFSGIAAAQTKTKVNMGSKNTIVMFADGLGADSVLMYPTGCGAPGNITRYTTAQNKSAFYHDSCSGLSYYYNIKTDEWASFVTPSIINSNPVYIVQDSLNAQPVSPDDSTYWLTGGTPTGTDWAGHPNAIAFYNGSVWSFPAITTGDNAFTLDTYVWHQYNGSTWPISTGYVLINGGNPQPVIMGSTVAQNVSLVYNKSERIKFVGAGMNFTQMTGTGLGIAQFGANGRVMRTEPASSSDTTTYKPLAISTTGEIIRASYWPGSGGGGGSQTWQQTLTTGSTLTGNNTITATGFAYTHNGAQFTRNLTDSILDAAPKISFAATDSLNGRSPIIYYKGGTVTFGGTTKAIIFKDSTFAEFKADGIRMSALTTGTTGSIMRQDAVGFLVKGATIALGSEVAGQLTEGFGGTNQTTYTTGDILYATGANTLGKRGIGSTNQVLMVVGGVPTWATNPNYWNRQQYGALASTNILQPATLTDTVAIGPTATITALSALFNVGGTSRFWGRTSINTALNANYQLAIDGGSGTGRALIVSGQTRIDERLAVNTSADPATGVALGVTGSTVAAIYSLNTTGAAGSTMVHNQFLVGNQSGAATNSHTSVYVNVNNNSDASAVQTAALYRGIQVQIQTKSNSATPVTVGTGIEFELASVNARTQTFTTAYGFWTKPMNNSTTTQLITTGGTYYSFLSDSSLAATFTGATAWGFYQRANTANNIKNVFQGNTLVGSGTQNASAALEVISTTQGILFPRMTTTQRDAIASPADGLQVANITTHTIDWYNGTSWQALGTGGSGVTSVGQSFTGGLISVSGSPITTSGTLALTVAGTSGGIPYFSSSSTWASSAALTANAIMIGGGSGSAPSTTTTGTGVLTALGVNTGSAGAFVVNGGALGTPSSGTLTNATGLPLSTGVTGTLEAAQEPAHTGDVTNSAGSLALTISADAVTQAKTADYSANTFWANKTSGAANATSEAYYNPGIQTYAGTITWVGSVDPASLIAAQYNWTRIGNYVTVTFYGSYTTAGTLNTQMQLTLPTDCPAPIEPTGFTAASSKISDGYGWVDTGTTGAAPATRVTFNANAADNGYVAIATFGSQNAKAFQITVTYYTN